MKMKLMNQVGVVLLMLTCQFASAQNTNHLKGQSSPYLQRAANQPVDWRPFGREAFLEAQRLNRPILLDVGAIWCPWCSRMPIGLRPRSIPLITSSPTNSRIVRKRKHHCDNNELVELSVLRYKEQVV